MSEHGELLADAEHDRALREQIDPLVAQLSMLGKLELALRLTGMAIVAPVRRADLTIAAGDVQAELPAAARELDTERDGPARGDSGREAGPIDTVDD